MWRSISELFCVIFVRQHVIYLPFYESFEREPGWRFTARSTWWASFGFIGAGGRVQKTSRCWIGAGSFFLFSFLCWAVIFPKQTGLKLQVLLYGSWLADRSFWHSEIDDMWGKSSSHVKIRHSQVGSFAYSNGNDVCNGVSHTLIVIILRMECLMLGNDVEANTGRRKFPKWF